MEFPLDYYPPRDLELFAGWEAEGVIQNFEKYPDTIFDYDSNSWVLNKPGAKGGYKVSYVRNGARSLHLLDVNTNYSDALLNYEDMLKIGQTYKLVFWVTTDKANNPDTVLKLVHNNYPEYNKSNSGCEEMLTITGLEVGKWTQFTYEFTAITPWISFRAGPNSSLYFDDMIMAETGVDVGTDKLAEYLNNLVPSTGVVATSTNNNGFEDISPDTGEKTAVFALLSVVISCAVIMVVSRKNLVEVIEN